MNDKVLKVAFISNTAWYIYNYRTGLIKEMLKQGFNITVIIPEEKFYTNAVRELGCEVIILNKIQARSKNPFVHIAFYRELRKIFKVNNFNTVFSFTPKPNIWGGWASKGLKSKFIPTINGLGYVFINESFYSKLLMGLYRTAFKYAYKVIFQNPDDKLLFINKKVVKYSKALQVNGSGVSLNLFYPKPPKTYDGIRFLYAGRFIKEKGLKEYVEAASIVKQKYKNVKFLVLGMPANNPSTISLEQVEEWVKQGHIEYLGKTDNVSKVLDNIDVVVLPSYYREGIPKILIEASAKAIPIITTDSVGCNQTVEVNKNGYLVEPKNIGDLVEKMEKIIADGEEKRIQMGQYGRTLAEDKFDENTINAIYVNIVKENNNTKS